MELPPVACANCGYSRAGLAEKTSPCPECGSPTALSGMPRRWVIGTDQGLALLAWGLGLGLLALTWSWMMGPGLIAPPMPISPLPWLVLPLLLALAGTWTLADVFSPAPLRAWARRMIVGVVVLLSLALAARAVVGVRRDPFDLVQALGIRLNQVAEILFMLFLGVLLVLSSITRTILSDACRAVGLFHISGWMRAGRVLTPVVVMLILVGVRFEDRAEKAILFSMSTGYPARTLTEGGKFWLNFTGQGCKFAQMLLLATILMVGIGMWLASVLARHRLRCLTAAP